MSLIPVEHVICLHLEIQPLSLTSRCTKQRPATKSELRRDMARCLPQSLTMGLFMVLSPKSEVKSSWQAVGIGQLRLRFVQISWPNLGADLVPHGNRVLKIPLFIRALQIVEFRFGRHTMCVYLEINSVQIPHFVERGSSL